jgi:hypothetical protein
MPEPPQAEQGADGQSPPAFFLVGRFGFDGVLSRGSTSVISYSVVIIFGSKD